MKDAPKHVLDKDVGDFDENGHYLISIPAEKNGSEREVVIKITEIGIRMGEIFIPFDDVNIIHHSVIENVARRKYGK